MQLESLQAMVARINASAYIPHELLTTGATTRRRKMAKPVKLAKGREFVFKATKGGGESKYPWDQWLNGDLLLLEQSEGDKDDKGNVVNVTKAKDYGVDTNAMPGKLKTAARRRYKVVQVSRLDADGKRLEGALIIRARDMDAAERQEEDVLRAEEREEAKARRRTDRAGANGQPTVAPALPATAPAAQAI